MKKIPFPRAVLTALMLILLLFACLLTACGELECLHLRTDKTTYHPDCSQQGYVLHKCRDCGYSYKSDFVEPYGHSISTETVVPTCDTPGYTDYRCLTCDYHYTSDYIVPLGHKLVKETVAPGCESGGYTTYTCEHECGYTYVSDFVAPQGHTLTAAQFIATCTEGGYTRYVCSQCDLDYRSAVSAPRGHSFTDTVVRPSFSRTGYTTHTCFCGYSYTDSYVWYSDVFSGSYGDGKGILADGIDISHWNTNVNWTELAATGIDYVILRAASSRQMPDYMFESHYANARAVGLDIGCYFYTYATTVEELEQEIQQLLKVLDGKTFEYPIYFDLEDPSQEGMDTDTLMEMALVFCQTLTDNGYFPAIYTNRDWLVKRWNQEKLTIYYDIWYARYPEDYEIPPVGFSNRYGTWDKDIQYDDYGMWQYTQQGSINGISELVDLNFCYKDYPTIIKKYGYNGYTAQ